MRKRMQFLLLITLCCALGLSGCRRKPIEAITESETETESEIMSETESETKQSETESEKETEKKTATTRTSVTPSKTTKRTSDTSQTPTQTCPYCGNSFSTTLTADGTSPYSSHVAQEEAYIAYMESTAAASSNDSSYDGSDYQTGSDGTLYAQCPYCYQWFSDAPDASGYSPYAEHVTAESAYAAQADNEEYVQCPNCGNWVTPGDYQEHIANGW